MMRRRVRRRSDIVTPKVLIPVVIVLMLIGGGSYGLVQAISANAQQDDVRQTQSNGVNLTTGEIGGDWTDRTNNIAIDSPSKMSQFLDNQRKQGSASQTYVEPDQCNSLFGAAEAFKGQSDKAMISTTKNQKYAVKKTAPSTQGSDDANDNGQEAPMFVQMTMFYTDSMSAKLALQSVQQQVMQCKNSHLTKSFTEQLAKSSFKDSHYTFNTTQTKLKSDVSSAYQIRVLANGGKKNLLYTNIGIAYSAKQNALTVIFIRSSVDGYNAGQKDMQTALPLAFEKMNEIGPKLGGDDK